MPKKANSAARRARSDARKRARNQATRARVRTGLRSLFQMLKSDPKKVPQHAREVVSWVDRAVKSGVLHRNAGNRLKARAMALAARR
jgi:small subunit ribosomal protein S20